MSLEIERQWAAQLRSRQNKALSKKQRPFETQEREIKEALKYHKTKLQSACHRTDKTAVEKEIENLINTFAKQTALRLEKWHSIYENLPDHIKNQEIKLYINNCKKVHILAEKLLNYYASVSDLN